MNVIKFPGGRKGRGDPGEIDRASRLKGRLVDYVTRGPMSDRHGVEMRAAGLEQPEFAEYVDFTDWFIFEWEDDDGTTVLDEFLASEEDLTDEDHALLESWYDAVKDLFEVVEVAEDGVAMRDGEGEDCFVIPTNMKATELGWRPRTLVETRILPVGDVFLLSGIQSFYSGPELDLVPDGINLAAFANALDADEIGYGADEDAELFVEDVRELVARDRPEGSIRAAAYDYLAESTKSLKAETAERHAMAVSFLAHYAGERGVDRAADLDADHLLDFLAVWYPRVTPVRSLAATRQVLGAVGKLAAWIGHAHETSLGRDFRARVLPALKDDLPRTIKATEKLHREFPVFGLARVLGLLIGEEEGDEAPEAAGGGSFRARFAIVAVDGERVTLRGRAAETDSLHTVELPASAAKLLRPGDVVDGTFVRRDSQLMVEAVECIYCPASGL